MASTVSGVDSTYHKKLLHRISTDVNFSLSIEKSRNYLESLFNDFIQCHVSALAVKDVLEAYQQAGYYHNVLFQSNRA